MQNYLPACKIVSTHGVRGEMKALPLCDGAQFLAKFKRLYAAANGSGEARLENTGSVSRFRPPICSNTVMCPIQVAAGCMARPAWALAWMKSRSGATTGIGACSGRGCPARQACQGHRKISCQRLPRNDW